jgi:hypothetical protein
MCQESITMNDTELHCLSDRLLPSDTYPNNGPSVYACARAIDSIRLVAACRIPCLALSACMLRVCSEQDIIIIQVQQRDFPNHQATTTQHGAQTRSDYRTAAQHSQPFATGIR